MYIKERRKKKKFKNDPRMGEPTGRVDLLRRGWVSARQRYDYTLIGSFDVTKIVAFSDFPPELIQQLSQPEKERLREWFGCLLNERREQFILDANSNMGLLAEAVRADSCVARDELLRMEMRTQWVVDALKKRIAAENKRLGR